MSKLSIFYRDLNRSSRNQNSNCNRNDDNSRVDPKMYHVLESIQNQMEMTNVLLRDIATDPTDRRQAGDQGTHPRSISALEDHLKEFKASGFDLNQNHANWLPLHFAARMKNLPAVLLLLKYGARADATDLSGKTAIHYAAKCHFESLVKILFAEAEDDTEIERRVHLRSFKGETPLHCAASGGQSRAAKLLLSRGARVDAVNDKGDSPVHKASREDNLQVLKILLDYNPNMRMRNRMGWNPLQVICRAFPNPTNFRDPRRSEPYSFDILFRASSIRDSLIINTGSRNSSRKTSSSNSANANTSQLQHGVVVARIRRSVLNCGKPSPRKLQDFCRMTIRKSLGHGCYLPDKLKSIPLPARLKDFLLLRTSEKRN